MADADDKKHQRGHNLADHLYGENIVHEHDEYTDHDHDHFEFDDDGPLEQNPIWLQDHVTLSSVGIDIGSSGTQVIFSRINLRRYGEDLTSRYYVVSRETLYQSPVALTPYSSEERIDDAGARPDHRRRLCGRGPPPRPDRHRRGDPHRRGAAARERRRASPRSSPSRAASSSAPPPAITWSRCSRPTAPAPRACRTTRTSASSTSTSAAAPPSSRMVEKGHVIATAAVHIGGRLQVVDDKRPHRAARPGRPLSRAPGRLRLAQGRRDRPERLSTRSPRRMADELVAALTRAADAARGRAPLPHRSDPRFRPHRRHDVLRRRRRIRLWPRDARLRRHGAPARPGDPRARSTPARCRGRCCRRANASAPPRSARRNTASSSPATPATSASPASSCRAATCRWCSRPSSAGRSSTRRRSPRRSAAISPPST